MFEAAEACNCKPWTFDITLSRSRVWWREHALAYKATREFIEDYKEAQLFKAMAKSGMSMGPRRRK